MTIGRTYIRKIDGEICFDPFSKGNYFPFHAHMGFIVAWDIEIERMS